MKARYFAVLMVIAMLFSAFGVDNAFAGAYTTQFTTSVTYMNVGTATTTTLKLYFYADPADTTPTSFTLANAAQNAAGSLYIGGLDDLIVADGFQGSAYMESDQLMQVTLVQLPQASTTVKNRALSNGFIMGGPKALIATVLKNAFSTYTIFSVQNADTVANDVTIKFYDTTPTLWHTIDINIAPGASYYVDTGLVAELPVGFNGSVVIEAKRSDQTNGSVVASAMELEEPGVGLKAFEGVSQGAQLLYMASSLCGYYGTNTSYAVQNTNLTTSTDVTVTFTDTAGVDYVSATKTIGPGAKASFVACDTMPLGKYGAAIVESTVTDVVAVGKAYGAGLTTAFLGVEGGSEKMGLPYVRYATDANYAIGNGQRTFISVQNVGRPLVEAEEVDVNFYDYTGALAGTYTYVVPAGGLATGAKFSCSAASAGLLEFGITPVYGGAAIIVGPATSELSAIGRVSTQIAPGSYVSEDYNSQPIQ